MATINGSPSAPARANDFGVPPTPSQIGRILHRPRVDPLPRQRSPVLAGPLHMLVLADREQQPELLLEQRVVVLQPESEERKRLDGRPTTDDHLRTSAREQIESREF